MKVYIVLGGWAYEGQTVFSVHATQESAEQGKEVAYKSGNYFDYVDIEEREVQQ